MKKRLAASVLSLALALSMTVPGWAADPLYTDGAASPGTEQAEAENPEHKIDHLKDSVLYYGCIKQMVRDESGKLIRLVMESEAYGSYIINLPKGVAWVDSGNRTRFDPSVLELGEGLYIFHGLISASSLPPQSTAIAVVRNVPQDTASAHYHVISGVEALEGGAFRIETDQGGLLLSADSSTERSQYADGAAFSLEGLKPGDRIMAWYGAVQETYPAQAHAQYLMLLPAEQSQAIPSKPKEGDALTLVLNGKTFSQHGRYEKDTAMIPVAAVAEALGYQVTYTPKGLGALVTVESEQFQVRLDIGGTAIVGVTKAADAVGMTAPQEYGKAPYIVNPGTTWAPARLFEMLGRTVTLNGKTLSID